jgi:tetrahydromethanopterin S-methyltransferase subunit C
MYMIKAMTIVAPANCEKGPKIQRHRTLGLPTHPAAMSRCCVDWDRGALAFGAMRDGSVDVGVCADATAAGFKSDDMVG